MLTIVYLQSLFDLCVYVDSFGKVFNYIFTFVTARLFAHLVHEIDDVN